MKCRSIFFSWKMLHFLGRSPKLPAKEVFSRCRANTTTLYPSQLVKLTKQCDQKIATESIPSVVVFVRDAVFLRELKGCFIMNLTGSSQ